MIAFLQVFFIGIGVSFLGQLPLGNMNMIATQLSVQEGVRGAWKFGLGIAIVEIIYLRIALSGMNWVLQHMLLFNILTWATVLFFLVLGVVTIVAASKQQKEAKGVLVQNKINRFFLGASLSAINPIQVPFWFTWTITLFNNGLLAPNFSSYNWFTIGAGLGTLGGIGVYIHGGKWAVNKMGAKNRGLNYIMGSIFIIAALIQLYKNIQSPFGVPE
ncbi:LysE family translocator [Aridibaculum aurantiacum]|uniref:LysE family translocator n=1 Tax=Aridibaculum aurantiacum TaxID=2810307 RepID=UPI001A9582A9|nr:LysE family transporter [Aridibaculum aurantiacum]